MYANDRVVHQDVFEGPGGRMVLVPGEFTVVASTVERGSRARKELGRRDVVLVSGQETLVEVGNP